MKKYNIIGVMTGNSMDACDVVLTEFGANSIVDVATYSKNFDDKMRKKIELLRQRIYSQKLSGQQLLQLPEFNDVHDEYINFVYECINDLIKNNNIDKTNIDAIGFSGKTLMHNCVDGKVFTMQMGSGQMLSDLLGIDVINDFRSDDVMAGGQGAPLAPVHNANMIGALNISDALFYNAGNTSNVAVVIDNKAVQGFDCGPFNEFVDRLVRDYKKEVCDFDGKYGKQGKLITNLFEALFYKTAITKDNQNFYEIMPPKSGDPAIYAFDEIKNYINDKNFCDVLYTVEYFAAYVAVYSLRYVDENIKMPSNVVLFGGGWYNPVCLNAFEELLLGNGYVLGEHKEEFVKIVDRFDGGLKIIKLDDSQYWEARTFADLARYKLEGKEWSLPCLTGCEKPCVLGVIKKPNDNKIDDKINRLALSK